MVFLDFATFLKWPSWQNICRMTQNIITIIAALFIIWTLLYLTFYIFTFIMLIIIITSVTIMVIISLTLTKTHNWRVISKVSLF